MATAICFLAAIKSQAHLKIKKTNTKASAYAVQNQKENEDAKLLPRRRLPTVSLDSGNPSTPCSCLLSLRAVVEDQSTKLNARVAQLAGVVESNKAEQAHLNAQVNAELKRMAKVGEDRALQAAPQEGCRSARPHGRQQGRHLCRDVQDEEHLLQLALCYQGPDEEGPRPRREGSVWCHHQALRHPSRSQKRKNT